ncbi:MAG: OmpA family protein, partial [Pseudomonadota bacterium]
LASYGASVRVTSDDHWVRIDLTDMAIRPLFETGDGALNGTGEDLVRATARVLAPLSWPVKIEGHTDSIPSETPGYSNWELSADRANSARRILLRNGVNPARFQGVMGLSHTKPLIAEAPHLPANRRISIVLDLNRADAL